MHPRITMFLRERDRARARGDQGVVRAITADLRRLGVSDFATLANPSGERPPAENGDGTRRGRGRPPKPRCDHGAIADRCEECRIAEIEEARVA